MDLFKWADSILQKYPTNTIPEEGDWDGVENAVDVLSIAIAIKELQKRAKQLFGDLGVKLVKNE